jgi:hypothetical protein
MLYRLSNVVTKLLLLNCKGCVSETQLLNVEEKFTTLGELSNKFNEYELNRVQPLNADAKLVAEVFELNNPDGIVVIEVNENISLNVVAFGENENISVGIVVTPVPLIKPAKLAILANPLYSTSIVDDAGIDVILIHPKKSKVRNPTLPKSII